MTLPNFQPNLDPQESQPWTGQAELVVSKNLLENCERYQLPSQILLFTIVCPTTRKWQGRRAHPGNMLVHLMSMPYGSTPLSGKHSWIKNCPKYSLILRLGALELRSVNNRGLEPHIPCLILFDVKSVVKAAKWACSRKSTFDKDTFSERTAQDRLARFYTREDDVEYRTRSRLPFRVGDKRLQHLVDDDPQQTTSQLAKCRGTLISCGWATGDTFLRVQAVEMGPPPPDRGPVPGPSGGSGFDAVIWTYEDLAQLYFHCRCKLGSVRQHSAQVVMTPSKLRSKNHSQA